MVLEIKVKIVFLIGILSSPLLYFLMAFAYLAGMSMGLFQKQDKRILEEEFSSNIINYEVLTPGSDVEINDACYDDFLLSAMNFNVQLANFDEFIFTSKQFNTYSPPREEFLQYQYLVTSNLFNRPPPLFS